MKYALCTISFRHQLISFAELLRYAGHNQFNGIELWGIHALNLYEHERESTEDQLEDLADQGLEISMISDYLDISTEAVFTQTVKKCAHLIEVALWLGAKRIRTFAGQKSSSDLSLLERAAYAKRLQLLGDLCQAHQVHLLVETHPLTLTDNVESTLELLSRIKHNAIGINLDFLHIWESGADPLEGYRQLKPWVGNFHLKNVSSIHELSVFHPHNVYSATGSRQGMVPLQSGIIDYRPLIREIEKTELYASLEWFGPKPLCALKDEISWLRHCHNEELHPVETSNYVQRR